MIGHPPFDAFYEIWNEARGDNLMPNRTDMRLTRLGELANAVSIFEIISPTFFRFTFTGPDVAARAGGAELLTENLLSFNKPEAAAEVSEKILIAVAGNCATFHIAETHQKGVWVPLISSVNLPVLTAAAAPSLFITLALPAAGSIFATDSRKALAQIDRTRVYGLDIGAGVPEALPDFEPQLLEGLH